MAADLRYNNLSELFEGSLGAVPRLEKVCLEVIRADRCEQFTFRQLKTGAVKFAAWLRGYARIRPADKVAILGRNRTDWDVAFWGSVLAGAVAVLIDPERGPQGVIDHLRCTDTAVLVMAEDYLNREARRCVADFVRGAGIALVEMTDRPLCDALASQPGPGPDRAAPAGSYERVAADLSPDETAVILCTSGTTGDPRGVELTHGNLLANIAGCIEKIHITSTDVLGHILPPHHSFGLTVGKLLPLAVGARNIYTDNYRRIPQLIGEKGVTIFIAVPAVFTMFAKKIDENLRARKRRNPFIGLVDRYAPRLIGRGIIRRYHWQRLRFFLSGAAPVPRWVLEVFWRHGLGLYEGYGTTENSPVYGFNDDPRRLGSVGKPISTVYVKIVDDENRALGAGQTGEILLGGPCITKGYYKDPAATAAAVETDAAGVRWLHTGDLGYLDREGNLYITGRRKFLIVLPGGKNVNPELVESAISEARFVDEVLVVPALKKGCNGIVQETIRAIVQPAWEAIQNHTHHSYDELANRPELLKSIIWQSINETQKNNKRLASFEKLSPADLEVKIDGFEKTSTGKIKRQAYIRL